jgi:hypothetical protein
MAITPVRLKTKELEPVPPTSSVVQCSSSASRQIYFAGCLMKTSYSASPRKSIYKVMQPLLTPGCPDGTQTCTTFCVITAVTECSQPLPTHDYQLLKEDSAAYILLLFFILLGCVFSIIVRCGAFGTKSYKNAPVSFAVSVRP